MCLHFARHLQHGQIPDQPPSHHDQDSILSGSNCSDFNRRSSTGAMSPCTTGSVVYVIFSYSGIVITRSSVWVLPAHPLSSPHTEYHHGCHSSFSYLSHHNLLTVSFILLFLSYHENVSNLYQFVYIMTKKNSNLRKSANWSFIRLLTLQRKG